MHFPRARRRSDRKALRNARTSSRDLQCGSLAAHLLLMVKLCPLVPNSLHQFAQIEIQALSLNYELLHFALQQTLPVTGPWLGNLRNNSSNPGPRLEPPFVDQVLHNTVRGVGMDFEFNGERSNRRQLLSRLQFAADECSLDGKYQLVEDGFAGLQVQPKKCHMRTVTHVILWSQAMSDGLLVGDCHLEAKIP